MGAEFKVRHQMHTTELIEVTRSDLPKGGLDPPRVPSHAPQTCASTSSATSACLGRTFTTYSSMARGTESRLSKSALLLAQPASLAVWLSVLPPEPAQEVPIEERNSCR